MLQPDYHETSFTNEWRFLGALAGALNRAQDALANATISWHCHGHAVMSFFRHVTVSGWVANPLHPTSSVSV